VIRAALAAVVCWATLGALGLFQGVASPYPAREPWDAGIVSAPESPDDPRVVEVERLTWSATLERSAPGAGRAGGRGVALVGGHGLPLARSPWDVSCPHDTRVASRMSGVAQRAVDLRREVFRTLPGRRVGRAEAAPSSAPLQA